MTGRSRELLLELLLLSERYTASEIAWVKKELSKYPDVLEIAELLRSFRKLPAKLHAVEKAAENPEEVQKNIRIFISDLLKRRSIKGRQRVLSIARRLGVSEGPGSFEDIIERIQFKLLEMSTEDAAQALRTYKVPTTDADKAYVGLANFLIRKPDA